MYLYLLSNTIWKNDGDIACASKIFLLNKTLHGIDVFYSVELPEIFLFVHPIGTILGNAKYSNYFVAYQNCTVGSTEDGIYPSFDEEVALYSGSSVIGNCSIGTNSIIGSNSFIINSDIGSNKVVLGAYPNNRIIKNKRRVIKACFNNMVS